MRSPFPTQPTLDTLDIAHVPINTSGRDPIIPILVALQQLYRDSTRCDQILTLIAGDVNATTHSDHGRPGLTYWQILVLAAVRLGCNFDYDHLQQLAQEHRTLRRLLGVGSWDDDDPDLWDWRRLRDNLCKIRPETLEQINAVVVAAGHDLQGRPALETRGDSFVCETNIHYPTDASVLRDGLRKILTLAAALAVVLGLPGWRQVAHLQRTLKRLVRDIGRACKSKQKGAAQRRRRAYQPFLKRARKILKRARALESVVRRRLAGELPVDVRLQCEADLAELCHFLALAETVAEQARRRVVFGEKIPSLEKILSVFEPHTEVICKGKVGAPVQFGRQVLVLEDQFGYIVHYELMGRGQQDKDVGVPALQRAQTKVAGRIVGASFDRGFHTPKNQKEMAEVVVEPCVPKRGPKQAAEQEATATAGFRQRRQRHGGIESAIHALQAGNGLERCRDHSERGLARYVGLAVLGRNLQVLGQAVLRQAGDRGPATATRRQKVA